MDQLLEKILPQAPGTAVAVILVILFLKFLKHERKAQQDFLTTIIKEHLDERKLSRDAIKENSAVLQSHQIAIVSLTRVLDNVADALDKKPHYKP